MKLNMNDLIALKACFATKKNSETSGRMFIACRLKTNESSSVLASKNVALVDKSIKWIGKYGYFYQLHLVFAKKYF